MLELVERQDARGVAMRFVDIGGRTLAYRRIGEGPPLVLCLRFRGVLDDWDPAFLDALAADFTVFTFDYSGLGQSTGKPSYVREQMAQDAKDLVDAFGLGRIVIGGWSIGGAAAQIFAARYPRSASHVIAIGTLPPGPPVMAAEPIFLETALKPVNSLEDEFILFFEPQSPMSRAAGIAAHDRIALRTADRSPAIAPEIFVRILQESHDPTSPFPDPDGTYRRFYAETDIPLLAINGDHDIVFPVENWYALNRTNKSLHILTFPEAGHGPHHQLPGLAADAIASFVRNVG